MYEDFDKAHERRQQRREALKRKQMRQRLLRRRILMILVAVLVLAGLVTLVTALIKHISSPEPTEAPIPETSEPIETQPIEPETVIDIAFAGDLNVTQKTVNAGLKGDAYNYKNVFMDVMPLLAGADTAVLNLEGNLCGAPYGTDGRAPQALAQALSAAGVDLVQMANSRAVDNGILGLQDTLSGIRDAGMEPVGAWGSNEEFEKSHGFTFRSIYGVKVAFVAFTKGVGNLGLPAGSEDCVNLLYKDYTSTYQEVDTEGITEILKAVEREKPDVTIALLHWGSEYNNQISDTQRQIVSLMQKEGVDAIIGTHSHYVQPVEFNREKGTVVAWSLGDFFGDGEKSGTDYSLVLNLQITRDNNTGKARITDLDYTPIYTVTAEDGSMRILRIPEAIAAYEADGVDKVSDEVYAAMLSAQQKVVSRVDPENE
ncbi:MAG: CapA family protein [Oscillospiraceae bacterium]|nr:CapA family protein [Oscillospiraceae bacterium]